MDSEYIIKILDKYSHLILYSRTPITSFCQYSEYEVNEEADSLKIYSGENVLSPVCALYFVLRDIKEIVTQQITEKADELEFILANGNKVNLLAYRHNN